ncbi:hypothetical protein DL98DRAFT_608262 [Cadophora sp. DSE1049]|nr:hypothetical protein DL98DRAFT_608262 [Cadophora sp. DSE1049]
MDSFGANMASGNQDQDQNAMDIVMAIDTDDTSTEQQSAQPDLSSSAEQLPNSSIPPPDTLAKMLGRHVLDTIVDAKVNALQYTQQLQEERANGNPDPDTDSGTDSDPDLDPDTDMNEAPAPRGLLDQSWDFSNLTPHDEQSDHDGEQNSSKPLTDADIMSMAIVALNEGTIGSQVNRRCRRGKFCVGPPVQVNICTKATRVTRSNAVTNRRQVVLPRHTDEKRKLREIAHRRVMGEAKVLKR